MKMTRAEELEHNRRTGNTYSVSGKPATKEEFLVALGLSWVRSVGEDFLIDSADNK